MSVDALQHTTTPLSTAMYRGKDWRQTSRNDSHGVVEAFVRPLVGSELMADQAALLHDGLLECCIGITLNSSFPLDVLREKLEYALARLRFVSPLVGATIESVADQHPFFRSWVYSPVRTQEELKSWTRTTLVVVNEPSEPSSFMRSLCSRKLPYILFDGRSQYLRLYLVRLDSGPNDFGVFFHGSHSIMDAKPTIRALSNLLEWVTDPEPLPLSAIAWGTEYQNLPPDPIAATGGLREDWQASYASLTRTIGRILDLPTPTSFRCESLDITSPAQQHRLLTNFSISETAEVLTALKTFGLTFTHLVHAAVALVVFDLADTPLEPEADADAAGAHVTFQNCIISIDRYFTGLPYEFKQHFVSASAVVPMTIARRAICAATEDRGRARLVAASKLVRAQFDNYLANPCLPHLAALQHMPDQATIKAPNASTVELTNVGDVEKDLPVLWPAGSASPTISVDGLHVGLRLTIPALLVHTWTMRSQLHVQIQAPDNWNRPTLETFMQAIVRQIKLIRNPE
ncbi:hypothetical protein BD414DRAFT_108089 [Trametes punicea]|nr:hypothetical protein BD414DRAFT_108089 [Trametes punicea]